MKKYTFTKILMIILFVVLAAAALSFVVMHLWNWLIPAIFGTGTITFWQAAGILLLSKILFGGFHKHGHGRHKERWRKHWREKWEGMTAEEREKFKADYKMRCRAWRSMHDTSDEEVIEPEA